MTQANLSLIKINSSSVERPRAGGCSGTVLAVPRATHGAMTGWRKKLGKDSRQGLVIIDEVGHAEEFLHCLHHFGGFCSEQLAIQHQDLQGARQSGEVSLAPSPALLRQEDYHTFDHLGTKSATSLHKGHLLNTSVPWCSLALDAGK